MTNHDGRCPTCDSPQPSMYPAVSGGGEAIVCDDSFHYDDGSYIRAYYNVPATLNREITFQGRRARIVGFDGARLRILLDGETVPAHPTWAVDYLDGRGVRIEENAR